MDFSLVAESVCATVGMLGIEARLQKPAEVCDSFRIESDVVVLIGLVGGKKYNLAFALADETALRIAGAMMGGAEPAVLDAMGRSAAAEFVNMISGNIVSSLPEELTDITPPTVVSGRGVCCVMQSFESARLRFQTGCGPVTVHIALDG